MQYSATASAALSIAMLAAFLLLGVGAKLIVRRQDRQRGVLMVIAALVIVGNVLIWTL